MRTRANDVCVACSSLREAPSEVEMSCSYGHHQTLLGRAKKTGVPTFDPNVAKFVPNERCRMPRSRIEPLKHTVLVGNDDQILCYGLRDVSAVL